MEGIRWRCFQCLGSEGRDRYYYARGDANKALFQSFRLSFKASNNEAKYETLLVELRAVLDLGALKVEVYSDSRLVANQLLGNFEAKDPWMISYLRLVKQTMIQFQNVKMIQIAWGQNRHAHFLAILASSLSYLRLVK